MPINVGNTVSEDNGGELFQTPGGGKYYEVEEILKHQFRKRQREYKYCVRWKGYEKPQWIWARHMLSQELVDEYHDRKRLPRLVLPMQALPETPGGT